MKPIVSIIVGSTSDLPIMEKTAAFLNDMQVPFEMTMTAIVSMIDYLRGAILFKEALEKNGTIQLI